jgi:hypothetical protein
MLDVFGSSLHVPFQLIPAAWSPILLEMLSLKVIGILLILIGDFVFVWALASLENSWRVGIDEKKALRQRKALDGRTL